MAGKSYRVTAPYITVKTMTPDGIQVRGLHAGAPMPADVDPDSLQHHLDQGLIEEVLADSAQEERAEQSAKEAARDEEIKAKAEADAAAKAETGVKAEATVTGPGRGGHPGRGSTGETRKP